MHQLGLCDRSARPPSTTIDEAALAHDDWVHGERRVPVRADGSTAWM